LEEPVWRRRRVAAAAKEEGWPLLFFTLLNEPAVAPACY